MVRAALFFAPSSVLSIASDKEIFFRQKVLKFFLFHHENMLWVIIPTPIYDLEVKVTDLK